MERIPIVSRNGKGKFYDFAKFGEREDWFNFVGNFESPDIMKCANSNESHIIALSNKLNLWIESKFEFTEVY